jgi:hypothetical protein
MTRRIPITEAKRVADAQGLSQVVLLGWDGERRHIVTYGKTKTDCEAAAKAQDFWAGNFGIGYADPLSLARERNYVSAWMIERGYATGHGDTVGAMLDELEWQIRERKAAEFNS